MVEALSDGFARSTYFDAEHKLPGVKLLPGEYHVSREDMVQVTVLGSCVAACIRDTRTGYGGMNHFMLPDGGGEGNQDAPARYGVYAMEVLINSLIKLGANRQYFEAKVFGGGNVMRVLSQSNVGQRNAEFVLDFLAAEKIRVAARDLEDIYPRKVYFFPASGKVRVKKLLDTHSRTIVDREVEYKSRVVGKVDSGGDIELFG
jgi:chemotaxis protein CheD